MIGAAHIPSPGELVLDNPSVSTWSAVNLAACDVAIASGRCYAAAMDGRPSGAQLAALDAAILRHAEALAVAGRSLG